MLKTFDIIMIMVMISAAAVTFRIKANSEAELREVRQLERQIAYEEESIDLLKADWSLLTQPSRVQRLVDAHKDQLGLQPTESTQVTGLDAIPEKGIGEPAGDPIADAIAASEGGAKPEKQAKAASKSAVEQPDTETETGSVEE